VVLNTYADECHGQAGVDRLTDFIASWPRPQQLPFTTEANRGDKGSTCRLRTLSFEGDFTAKQ